MPDRTPRDLPPGQAQAGWATLLLLAALMLLAQDLPWSLAAAVPAAASLVLGVLAVRARLRAGARPAAVWAGVGVLFAVYLLVDVVAQAVFYGPLTQYSACHAGALTDLAEGVCRDGLVQRIGSAADVLRG